MRPTVVVPGWAIMSLRVVCAWPRVAGWALCRKNLGLTGNV